MGAHSTLSLPKDKIKRILIDALLDDKVSDDELVAMLEALVDKHLYNIVAVDTPTNDYPDESNYIRSLLICS